MVRLLPVRAELLQAEVPLLRRLGRPSSSAWRAQGWASVFGCRSDGAVWKPLKRSQTTDRQRVYLGGKCAVLDAVIKEIVTDDPLGRPTNPGGQVRERDLVFHLYDKRVGEWKPGIAVIPLEPESEQTRLQVEIDEEAILSSLEEATEQQPADDEGREPPVDVGQALLSELCDGEGAHREREEQASGGDIPIIDDSASRMCPGCQRSGYDGDTCRLCGYGSESYGRR